MCSPQAPSAPRLPNTGLFRQALQGTAERPPACPAAMLRRKGHIREACDESRAAGWKLVDRLGSVRTLVSESTRPASGFRRLANAAETRCESPAGAGTDRLTATDSGPRSEPGVRPPPASPFLPCPACPRLWDPGVRRSFQAACRLLSDRDRQLFWAPESDCARVQIPALLYAGCVITAGASHNISGPSFPPG